MVKSWGPVSKWSSVNVQQGRGDKERQDSQKSNQIEIKELLRMWYTGVTIQLVWLQNPEGVKTFMSRGLSLCARGGACFASTPEISILGGMKLAGSCTSRLT